MNINDYYIVSNNDGKCGVLSKNTEIIPCLYDRIDDYQDHVIFENFGLIEVYNYGKETNMYGYVNKNGKVVIPLIYNEYTINQYNIKKYIFKHKSN